jgi:hypothetical protein
MRIKLKKVAIIAAVVIISVIAAAVSQKDINDED